MQVNRSNAKGGIGGWLPLPLLLPLQLDKGGLFLSLSLSLSLSPLLSFSLAYSFSWVASSDSEEKTAWWRFNVEGYCFFLPWLPPVLCWLLFLSFSLSLRGSNPGGWDGEKRKLLRDFSVMGNERKSLLLLPLLRGYILLSEIFSCFWLFSLSLFFFCYFLKGTLHFMYLLFFFWLSKL